MKSIYLFILALLFAFVVNIVVIREARGDVLPPQLEVRGVAAPILRHVQALQVELREFEAVMEQRCPARPCYPRLTWSGSLSGGASVPGTGFYVGEAPTTPFVEGRLALAGLPLDVTASVTARHYFDDVAYWRDKRRVVVGLEMPVGRDISLFGEFENRYSVGEAYTVAGFRLRFGGDGR